MPLSSRLVRPALSKKGFTVDESKDVVFRHYHNGRRTGAWTKISQGNYEIHDGLIGSMKRQLQLRSNREVCQLCDCTMSGEQYVAILQQQGILPP